MKYIILFLCCMATVTVQAQSDSTFNGHGWEAPYHFTSPIGWGVERFQIPVSFAPQINYKGVEDVRFTPGWAKAVYEEYWTYAFLWWLDGNITTNADTIAAQLKAYYTGLVNANGDGFMNPAVTTNFSKATSMGNDLATYTGTVKMTDYMQRRPIRLNARVHVQACAGAGNTVLFFELSPQPFNHRNWPKLLQLWTDFRCEK